MNTQILKIFNQVIKDKLPPSISDVERNASEGPPSSSVQIVSNSRIAANRRENSSQGGSLPRSGSLRAGIGTSSILITTGQKSPLDREMNRYCSQSNLRTQWISN